MRNSRRRLGAAAGFEQIAADCLRHSLRRWNRSFYSNTSFRHKRVFERCLDEASRRQLPYPKHGLHRIGRDRQLDFCVEFGFDVGTFSTRDPRVPYLLAAYDTPNPAECNDSI